jgi:hypothetical protein
MSKKKATEAQVKDGGRTSDGADQRVSHLACYILSKGKRPRGNFVAGKIAEDLDGLSKLAAAGYREYAIERVRILADALRTGTPIPEAEMELLLEQLAAIGRGQDPAVALLLKKKKKKKVSSGRERSLKILQKDHDLAWQVHHARTETGRLEDSVRGTGAFSVVAEQWGISEPQVKSAWNRFRPAIKAFIEGGLWIEPVTVPTPERRKTKKSRKGR